MKVAIIGAGFSGMLAAYLLEKRGIEVTVYEKFETLGGHCYTLKDKDLRLELGTVFTFSEHIRELLIELNVDYTTRFTYRNFVDEHFQSVEHMSYEDAGLLVRELEKLSVLLDRYADSLGGIHYGYIHEDLLVPLSEFLRRHDLKALAYVISPHLSSYGFGSMDDVQAYYAFNVFNIETINAFIKGNRLLFIKNGVSELISKLSQNISDIRYSIEVKSIEDEGNQVLVETTYGIDSYDKILITTKLPRDVIKDEFYSAAINKIDTNPFMTCAFEVQDQNLVTTYYKANHGKKEKIQFFYIFRQNKRTLLVAYAYGKISKHLVNDIEDDLRLTGIEVKRLITAKQWYVFPHIKIHNQEQDFYERISQRKRDSRICLIGSLTSKPSLCNLYASVKSDIETLFGAHD